MQSGGLEIIHKLGGVLWDELVDGLEFNDDFLEANEIGFVNL